MTSRKRTTSQAETKVTTSTKPTKKPRSAYRLSKKAKMSQMYPNEDQVEEQKAIVKLYEILEERKTTWTELYKHQCEYSKRILSTHHMSKQDVDIYSSLQVFRQAWSYCNRWEQLLRRFYDEKHIEMQRSELNMIRRLLDSDPHQHFLQLKHYLSFLDILYACSSPYLQEQYPVSQVMSDYILQSGPMMDRTLDVVIRWQLEPLTDLPEFHQKDTCTKCKSPLTLYKRHSLLVCKCNGSSNNYFNATSSALDYGRSPNFQVNEYNRKKFFDRYMIQFRKHNNPIDQKLLLRVKLEMMNRNLMSPMNTKMNVIRDILDSIGKKTYGLYASRIHNIMSGNKVAIFEDHEYRIVGERYNEVERVFLQLRSSKPQRLKRVNFPNFNFFLHKVCILEGWTDLKQYFPVQSVQVSLKDQEEDWKVFVEKLIEVGSKHPWETTLSR